MKITLLASLFIVACMAANAQSSGIAPDLNKIEKDISDPNSAFYYPDLLKRFQAGDSTFTTDQKRALYYGYSFQKEYSAYSSSPYEDSLRKVVNKDAMTEADYSTIIIFSDSVLKSNPFDMRTLKYRRYAAKKLGASQLYTITDHELDNIVDAIVTTGDGKTVKNGMWVITVPHEYEMLKVFGFEFAGSQSLIENCDYLTIKKNEWGIEGIYFNTSISLMQLERMLSSDNDDKKKKRRK